VYERRVFDVPQGSRTSMGRSVAQLLEFQPGEKVANTLAVKDFGKAEQFLLFATCRGVVKKTPLAAYGNIRTNGIIAIGLDEGDELVGVELTNGKDDVLLGTESGLAIRFGEGEIRPSGRQAGGVTGARFKRENDQVISLIVIPHGHSDSLKLLTATQKGYGKRTPLAEYPVKGRGTRGVINIEASDRNGDVVAMKLVGDADEVIFITQAGILMRTKVVEIRETGRGAQGVRLIKIDDGDRLVAMAKVDPEEEKVEDGAAQTAEGVGAASVAGVQVMEAESAAGAEPTAATDAAGAVSPAALSTDAAGQPLPEQPPTDGKVADGHAPDVPPVTGRDGEMIDPEE
jgi:DNA gyrase subunit A